MRKLSLSVGYGRLTNLLMSVLSAAALAGAGTVRAARAAEAADTAPGTIRWRAAVDSQEIGTSPALGADGTVYVGTPSLYAPFSPAWGYFYALDGATGAKKWSFPMAGVSDAAALGTNGLLYVASRDGQLYALDSATGVKRWAFAAPANSAPAIGWDGTVYLSAGSPTQQVYAVNGATGLKRWAFPLGAYGDPDSSNPRMSPPAIGSDGTVYAAGIAGRIYGLDGASGAEKWEFATGGPVRCSPALGDDGNVYVGSEDGKVYALDGASGTLLWTFATGGKVISSPAVDRAGTVYVGSSDHRVYALEASTGDLKWTFTAGGEVISSPALAADGTVYFGSLEGYFYALDGATGRLKWDLPLPVGGGSPSIGDDGTVYVGEFALNGTAGLANAPWPKFRQGRENRGLGSETGSPALTGPARIVRQPVGGPVVAGGDVALTVVARGVPPLSYQWYRDGQPLANGRAARFGVTGFGPGNAGEYWVWVTNAEGQARSAAVTLSAGFRLTVTNHGAGRVTRAPEQEVYAAGAAVDLTAVPEGSRRFLGWSGDGSGTNARITVTVARDMAVAAGFEYLPGDPRWRWRANADSTLGGPALGTNGLLYLGSRDQNIYAVEAGTGQVKWTFRTGGAAGGAPALGPDGTVFAASWDNKLYALDGATGSKRWAFSMSSSQVPLSSPAVAADGTLYVSADLYLFAVDGATGTKKWEATIGMPLSGASPSVGRDGTVYVGAYGLDRIMRIFALNPATGVATWTFEDTGYAVSASPAIGFDGTVYVGQYQNQFYALDGASGQRQWSFATGSPLRSAALGWDNTVYVPASGGELYALDRTTGTRKWAYLRPGQGMTAPALAADGTLYVGGNRLRALDGATGAELWSFDAGSPIGAGPTLGPEGTVFALTQGGDVVAVAGSAPLAPTAWPKDHADLSNSGQARAARETPPAVVRPPAGGVVEAGRDTSVSVIAEGATPLRYQWYFQGQPLTNGLAAVLALPGFGTAQAGEYYVVVSNALERPRADPSGWRPALPSAWEPADRGR